MKNFLEKSLNTELMQCNVATRKTAATFLPSVDLPRRLKNDFSFSRRAVKSATNVQASGALSQERSLAVLTPPQPVSVQQWLQYHNTVVSSVEVLTVVYTLYMY